MAYNILKGTVEFTGDNGSLENTVDLTTDQTVAGGKTFSQRITASAITLGGTNLSIPSITSINNGAAHRVALFDGSSPTNTLSGNVGLSFEYGALTSSIFTGSGIGLTSLQAQEITGKLSASQINFSNGLTNSGYNLIVSASHGISVGATGVSFNPATAGGLAITSSNGVSVDPTNALDITTGGQSLSDADFFIAHDQSRGKIVKADALDIYNYINAKISSPAIQLYTNPSANRVIVGTATTTTVNGAANLTFDGSQLTATGQISASLGLSGSAVYAGAGLVVMPFTDSATVINGTHFSSSLMLSSSAITTANGILKLYNDSGNSKIETKLNHLILRNSNNNKDIRVQLGENAGATEFQIRNNSNAKTARITSAGAAKFTELRVSGAVRNHYKVVGNDATANYNVGATDNVVLLNVTGAFTVNLPQITNDNKGVQYYVKVSNVGSATVTGSDGHEQFIDGGQSKALSSGDSIKLIAYEVGSGFDWAVLSFYDAS